MVQGTLEGDYFGDAKILSDTILVTQEKVVPVKNLVHSYRQQGQLWPGSKC